MLKTIIDGGGGGLYNFNVTETSSSQDGYALVVVYTLPANPVSTIGILDGWASASGGNTAVAFGTPIDPTAPGFFAEMRLGIGFSFDGVGCTTNAPAGQHSVVKVNGTTITENSGCNDDRDQPASPANGNRG